MSPLIALALLFVAQAEDEVETEDGDIVYSAPASDADRLTALEAEVERLKQERASGAGVPQPSAVTVMGYVDFGFFAPSGTGAGVAQDFGNEAFPQYQGQFAWLFYGDLLAPAVNSRGEVADLGALPGVERFDSINSGGAPGFVVNEVNLTLRAALGDSVLVLTSLDFMPRTGAHFALGDVFELDLAQLEWMPTEERRLSLFVGKMEPVIGVEYRQRKARNRFGVTPSLLARYTTGTPLGFKARAKLFKGDFLTVAAAVTNGSSTTEQFHFYDEVDSNAGKTVSGRLSVKPFAFFDSAPLGELEVGVSGEYGPQDRALDSVEPLWFLGVDVLWHLWRFDLEAQWLRGMAQGRAVDGAYGLNLNFGAYATLTCRITSLIGVLVRGEVRDAFVFLGSERAYLTKSWRVTAGVRLTFNQYIALKAEYLFNGEYGGVPQVPNDLFASSLVLSY
ncbi:MAG: hypothetical protein AMXMBFR34_23400 [Myxococcaceae bacterium]